MRALVLFLIIFFSASVLPAGEPPVLLVSNDYPPYVNTSKKNRGFLTDVIVAAFDAVGVPSEIEFRPWRRCALMVENGSAFGAFPYGVTEARKKYAWFSDELWKCHNVFFYLKGRFGDYDYVGLEDLRGRVIGGTSGNYYEDTFEDAGLTVDYAPSEVSGVRKLWDYRVEFFAEDELVGWSLISSLFENQKFLFASTSTPWNVNPQTLMVSKKYPGSKELLQRFNRGLKTIRENGTYDRIFQSHFKETPLSPR